MRRLLLLACSLLSGSQVGEAQAIRITGASWFQGIDLRPFRRDSVALSATTASDGVRRTANGTLVTCLEAAAWCTYLAAADREFTRPVLHDVSVAGWGFGEGISFHAHARARSAAGGSEASWPRLNDRFDLLDAYVELDRPAARVRLGRQWNLGGLGAYSYDGASLTLRGGTLDAEAFGGQALVQGLNEPYTSAEIGVVDDLPPEQRAWMYGGRARWRGSGAAVTATYVRVIQDDRSGLYAERASADASTRALGLRLAATLAYDLGAGVLNEGRLRVNRGVGGAGGVDLGVDVRRHRPFFELWTIWGAFAPVGFDEVRATTSWVAGAGTLVASASGAWRTYEDAGTGLASVPLRTNGWRVAGDVAWSPGDAWSLAGSYGADIGVGSSQSDGELTTSRQFGDRGSVGGSLSALQTIYEYRVGTGRVLGVSAYAVARLASDLRLRVEGGEYRHRLTKDAPGRDWSQRRVSVRLEWAVGADPGGGQ